MTDQYYRQPTPKRRVWPWVLLGSFLVIVFAFVACTAFVGAAVSTLPDNNSTVGPQSDVQPVVPNAVPNPNAFGDGTYDVPGDMPAGKYKTVGSGEDSIMGCTYTVKNTTQFGYSKGPGIFTVKNGQQVTLSGGCTWIKQ